MGQSLSAADQKLIAAGQTGQTAAIEAALSKGGRVNCADGVS